MEQWIISWIMRWYGQRIARKSLRCLRPLVFIVCFTVIVYAGYVLWNNSPRSLLQYLVILSHWR